MTLHSTSLRQRFVQHCIRKYDSINTKPLRPQRLSVCLQYRLLYQLHRLLHGDRFSFKSCHRSLLQCEPTISRQIGEA